MPETDAEATRRKNHWSLQKTFILLLVVIIVAAVSAPLVTYFLRRATAERVFREAKDVAIAIKLLSIEYHGLDKDMIDKRTASFYEDAKEDILDTACAPGNLRLISADSTSSIPLSYCYTSRNVMVVYSYDIDNGTTSWRVDYMINMFGY